MKYLLFFAFSFLLIACSKEISIEIPQPPPKLVINSLFSPDSMWVVAISRNAAPDWDSAYTPIVADANVDLCENDILLGKMSYIGNGKYSLPLYPKIGKKYTIKVSAPNFAEMAEATDSIPIFADSLSASLDTNTLRTYIDQNAESVLLNPLNIYIKDNPNTKNYYRFKAIFYDSCFCQVNSVNGINSLHNDAMDFPIYNDDPYTEKMNPNIFSVYSDDNHFNGQVYNFRLYAATGDYLKFSNYGTGFAVNTITGEITYAENVYVELYTDVYSLSEAYYRFSLDYYKQSYNISDPSATYLNAYSNVKGGYGLFAGYQRKRTLIYKK